MSVYLEGEGDVYVDMARGVFLVDEVSKEKRDICKPLVLGMSYGAQEKTVGRVLTVNGYPTTPEVGAEYLMRLQMAYPTFFAWREDVIAEVHETGYVTTIGGRHRRLGASFIDRRNYRLVGYGERQAVNAKIQGSAADIVRRVMVGSTRAFPELDLLVQVHDELVWETDAPGPSPERLAQLADFCATGHGFDLRVPLVFEVHVGDSWYSGKEGLDLELPEDLEAEDVTISEEEAA